MPNALLRVQIVNNMPDLPRAESGDYALFDGTPGAGWTRLDPGNEYELVLINTSQAQIDAAEAAGAPVIETRDDAGAKRDKPPITLSTKDKPIKDRIDAMDVQLEAHENALPEGAKKEKIKKARKDAKKATDTGEFLAVLCELHEVPIEQAQAVTLG